MSTTMAEAFDTAAGVMDELSPELTAALAGLRQLSDTVPTRDDEVCSLLVTVRATADQLRGLAAEHVDTLGPLLDRLDQVSAILERNRDNIDKTLVGAPEYIRQLGEAIASGPYFGVILQNVAPADTEQLGYSYGGER